MKDRFLRSEKKTVLTVIKANCRGKGHVLGSRGDCEACGTLRCAYERIEKCVFGGQKPVCVKSSVHCYRSDRRYEIAEAMRCAGPKGLGRRPVAASGVVGLK